MEMKVKLQNIIMQYQGLDCSVWEGTTPGGHRVFLLVLEVGCNSLDAQEEVAAAMKPIAQRHDVRVEATDYRTQETVTLTHRVSKSN